MKVICSQEELARSLQIAGRGLANKTTLPILSGMLLETRNEGLTVLSTDLELGIEVKVPKTSVKSQGQVVVPGKTFIDIIRHLAPGDVEISFDSTKGVLSIVSSNASFQLNTLPIEEFPSLPESFREVASVLEQGTDSFEDRRGGSVLGIDLKEAIRQSIYATSPEDPRPFLSSVLMEIFTDRLRIVATDINRLVLREVNCSGMSEDKILVPVRALREVANIFGNDPEDNIHIILADRQIFFLGKGIVFSSRLVDAQFPRYEQVIPTEFKGTMNVNRLEFMASLERISLLDNVVKITVNQEGLHLTANEPELGNAYEEVGCSYSGEDMQIGFNAKYLIDFLKTVEKEEITVGFSGAMKASLLQGGANESYRYVIMPMRLNPS